MKKLLFNYLSLLIAIVQLAGWIFTLIAVIWTFMDSTVWIVVAISFVLLMLFTIFVDATIRGFYKNLKMTAFDCLVSPARAVLQIITIVKMHKTGLDGEFADRETYGANDEFSAGYVLYNDGGTSHRSGKNDWMKYGPRTAVGSTTAGGTSSVFKASTAGLNVYKGETASLPITESRRKIMDRLAVIMGGVKKPTVILVPIVEVNGRVFAFCDYATAITVDNKVKHRYAEVTKLMIDDIVVDKTVSGGARHSSNYALYLKKGSYTITIAYKVFVNGNEMETSEATCVAEGVCEYRVSVTDCDNPVYLGLFVKMTYDWTKSTSSNGLSYCSAINWSRVSKFGLTNKAYLDSVVVNKERTTMRIDDKYIPY